MDREAHETPVSLTLAHYEAYREVPEGALVDKKLRPVTY